MRNPYALNTAKVKQTGSVFLQTRNESAENAQALGTNCSSGHTTLGVILKLQSHDRARSGSLFAVVCRGDKFRRLSKRLFVFIQFCSRNKCGESALEMDRDSRNHNNVTMVSGGKTADQPRPSAQVLFLYELASRFKLKM